MKKLSRYLVLTGAAALTIFAYTSYAQVTPAANLAPLPVAAPVPAPAPAPTATAVSPANGASVGAVNKKLNLEDITVKGELLSDDRMNFVRRQREELKNRIKFRTNFRPEILQEYKN